MSLYDRAQAEASVRNYTRRQGRKTEIVGALLGDGAGNIDVSGEPGWVWVRPNGDPDGVAEARNRSSVPLVYGIPVDLRVAPPYGYELVGLSSSVIYENPTVGPGTGAGVAGAAIVAAHAPQHSIGDHGISGFDPLTVNVRALAPLRARAQTTPDMTVQVDAGYYFIGSFKLFPSTTSGAFTAPVPPASTKYDLLYLGSDDALHILAGTPVISGTPTFPAVPANSIPICFVFLSQDSVAITESQIVDARVILTAALTAGGIGGAPDDAEYILFAGDASLANARTLAVGTAISKVDAGAGSTVTLDVAIDPLTGKGTPVDADETILADSAASFGNKKLTWANLKATLKTYFDTLYAVITHTTPTFVASGGSHAAGHVPDPGASAGSTKFLREDASWAVPPGSGAPSSSEFVTLALDAGLSAERVLTPGVGSTLADNGANSTVVLSVSPFPTDPFTISISENGYPLADTNSVSYRYQAITSIVISGTKYQAVSFWDLNGYMVLGKRVLDGAWTLYTYNGSGGLPTIQITNDDHHREISIGLDPNGYLHISYDHHDEALKYRRSNAAINSWTGGLSATLSMLGTNESEVAYPTFFNDPSGVLYFIFRDGIAGNGDMYFYKYTAGTTTWAAAAGTTAGKVISGKTCAPTQSGYWNAPVFDSDFGSGGYLHLSWVWRDSVTGLDHDLSYVKWDGTNWKQSGGGAQTIPITTSNEEIVDAVPTSGGMTAFDGMASDSNGYPHIAYNKNDADGLRHVYHAMNSGSGWLVVQVTTTPGIAAADDSLILDITPVIAMDRSTNTAYILYHDQADAPGLLLEKSGANVFTTWTRTILYPEPIEYEGTAYGPHFDWQEWLRDGIFYFLIEYWVAGQTQLPIRLFKWTPSTDHDFNWIPDHPHDGKLTQKIPIANVVGAIALSTNAPQDVGSTDSAGSGTAASKDDHVHEGVHSVAKSGSSALMGNATFTGAGGIVLNQVGQNIEINGGAIGSTFLELLVDDSGGDTGILFDDNWDVIYADA